MMFRAFSLTLVTSLSLLATPALANDKAAAPAPAGATKAAAAGPGVAVVKQANESLKSLLKQKAEPNSKEEKELANKLITSVRGFLDIDQLGKRAMVDNWSKLTKAQQDQFAVLLRDLIEENYIKGMRANLAYEIEYVSETPDKDGNVVVATKVKTQRKGRPYTIAIDYVLVNESGKLRAFDVRTDGVGLVENYRAMFNKIMAKDGFDGLIAKMKKKQGANG
ncbi:MAG: ABC transporter substrate-binding protein [Kofleriaceae bacterium]|nr:ABC transporter substrate-binding protein [Kofleriaceae bacterium]